MITDYGFVLARGDKGFRHFLKYTLFEAEKCISNFESKGISRTLERPDNYVIAKRIKSLYTEYIDGLSDDEKDAVKKIRYGKVRYEEYASFYGGVYKMCYAKWEKIFFRRNIYGNISKLLLGILIRSIREQQYISRAEICSATGYSYTRVRHYEMGNTLPTLDFLFKLSKIFGCSIDELIKVATEKI